MYQNRGASAGTGGSAYSRAVTLLHLVNVRWWNASAAYAVHAALALRARGHAAPVVADAGSPVALRARAAGLDVHEIPRLDRLAWRTTPAGVRALAHVLRRTRPAVVFAHRPESHAWAACGLAFAGVDARLVFARTDARVPRAGVGQRWLAARTDGVVYPAAYAVERDRARLHLDPARTWVAPCPVDLAHFVPGDRAAARAALGLPSDAPIAAMVARFAEVKGQLDVLEAFARAAEPRAWLVLSGVEDDVRRVALAERAVALGVAERVRLLDVLPDPRVLFAAADVGVVASRGSEAICRVAAEWQACGRPVLGTRMHAVAEAIDDGGSGWLVPPGDIDAIAAQLARAFAADSATRQRFGEAARAHAEAAFAPERFGLTLDEIARTVCAPSARR